MITRIEVLNFKSLRYVDVRLNPFHVLVGPNASGKTSLLEALTFIGTLARGREVRSAIDDLAENIHDLFWMQLGSSFEIAVEAKTPRENGSSSHGLRYEIRIGLDDESEELGVLHETLWRFPVNSGPQSAQPTLRDWPVDIEPPKTIFWSDHERNRKRAKKILNFLPGTGNTYFGAEKGKTKLTLRLQPGRASLGSLPSDAEKFPLGTWFQGFLSQGVNRIVLDSAAMRRPSPPGSSRGFQPDGSNLPRVIDTLKKSRGQYDAWIDHVRTALPEIKAVKTVERPEDKHNFLVVEYESGLQAPSWVVSDGTLRLLALTVIAYLPDLDGLVLIEEPENGVHPQAIETVFQSLASAYGAQVLMATHSPVILAAAEAKDLLCFGRTPSGATAIVRGDRHPRLTSWKKETDLGTLFASGVLG